MWHDEEARGSIEVTRNLCDLSVPFAAGTAMAMRADLEFVIAASRILCSG